MLVIHFFLFIFILFLFIYLFFFECNVTSKYLLSLFLQKMRRSVLYSCKLIIFNWSINSPRETAVNIVLDVSENSRGNVYNMKFSVKLQPTNMEFVNPSRLRFSPDFPQKSFLELIYKSASSELINAVMEYINFRSSVSQLESITYKFTKNRTPSQ